MLDEIYAKKLGLDKYCYRIFLLMLVKMVFENDPMRFNELHKLVKDSRLHQSGMSKPTFNDHLKHLIKKGYVKRKRKGKQNVIYFLNRENPKISEAKEATKRHQHLHKKILKKLSSLTLDEFAKLITNLSIETELDQTRILIEDVLKPSRNRFDHVIAFSLNERYLQQLRLIMLGACMKNKEACAWALEALEKEIELKRKEVDEIIGL